jgi:hypothetical protein
MFTVKIGKRTEIFNLYAIVLYDELFLRKWMKSFIRFLSKVLDQISQNEICKTDLGMGPILSKNHLKKTSHVQQQWWLG